MGPTIASRRAAREEAKLAIPLRITRMHAADEICALAKTTKDG
jgi:hypothetical protein